MTQFSIVRFQQRHVAYIGSTILITFKRGTGYTPKQSRRIVRAIRTV